jgi:hypothetical protein
MLKHETPALSHELASIEELEPKFAPSGSIDVWE